MKLDEAFRILRIIQNIKQNEAAKKLKVSKSYLSEIECGRKNPTLRIIKQYSDVLKINQSTIIKLAENLELINYKKYLQKRFIEVINEDYPND